MTADVLVALILLAGYGVWFLALVREQRAREALDRLPGLFAALIPAAQQASEDIAALGRAFSKLAESTRGRA